jgi:hypothetical protein
LPTNSQASNAGSDWKQRIAPPEPDSLASKLQWANVADE